MGPSEANILTGHYPESLEGFRLELIELELHNSDPHTLWQFNIATEDTPFMVDLPVQNGEFYSFF